MATIAQPLQSADTLDLTLRRIFNRNLALRLLLAGGYRWTALAVVLVLVYFGVGLALAFRTNSVSLFIQFRPLYITLLGIVQGVVSACWYAPLLIEVISSVPRAFAVEQETIQALVEQWTKYISLPLPLTTAFIAILISFLYNTLREPSLQSASFPGWFSIYWYILIMAAAFIVGGGLEVLFVTILLFHKIFQYKLNLAYYRHLYPLNTMSMGMTVFCLAFIALLIFIIVDQIDSLVIIMTAASILSALLVFLVPQISYQRAVIRAKRNALYHIDRLYEHCYRSIEKSPAESGSLKELKEAIQSLEVLENNVKSIPVWLINLSDIPKIILSALAPILSLVLKELLTKWI